MPEASGRWLPITCCPSNWSKPIVEQVFLPAHAAVSGITLSNPCTVELVSGDQNSSIDVIRVSGFVTPPVGGLQVAIATIINGGANSGAETDAFTTTAADGSYSTEITLAGPGVIGVGVGVAVSGASTISGCALGIPPAQTAEPGETSRPRDDDSGTCTTSTVSVLVHRFCVPPDGTAGILLDVVHSLLT